MFYHQHIYWLVFHLIQATNDLENYDKERHDEFKRYEMMKEHNRREHLKTLDDKERRKEEEHYEEMRKKHADHPKINHPVSVNSRRTDGGWFSLNELVIATPVCRGARISSKKSGRRPTAWTLKTLTLRPSSNCTVDTGGER